MKILILSPNQINRYNWGHALFRKEIGCQHNTLYYGEGYPKYNPKLSVPEIIKKFYKKDKPDVILTYGWRYSVPFKGLGDITDIGKVHINVDYVREPGITKQNKFFKQNKYDLVFAITQRALDLHIKNKVCNIVKLLPFSVDTKIYKYLYLPKENRVFASFTDRVDIYPNRRKARNALKKAGIKVTNKRIIHRRLINNINRCKITLTSNNKFGSLSMRYTETLGCGGFLLADKPEDLELLGYEDGKHLVIYKNINDLVDKAKYYLNPKNENERCKIAKQGMKFVRRYHSCEQRVKDFAKIINEELGIK